MSDYQQLAERAERAEVRCLKFRLALEIIANLDAVNEELAHGNPVDPNTVDPVDLARRALEGE